jgi:hypothetical protein
MKIILQNILLIALFFVFSREVYSQYDYDRGFKTGYKEGYCYGELNCISPISPTPPIPQIGENHNNYKDGYNRGFKRGLEDKEAKGKSNSTTSINGNNTNNYYQKMGENKWRELQMLYNLSENMRLEAQRTMEIRKQKAISMIERTRQLYNSYNSYPSVTGGEWYNVIVTNGYDFCEERKVSVIGNEVNEYIIENFMKRKVTFSTKIKDCKCFIKTQYPDGKESDFLEIFFLERILQPNSTAFPPNKGGSVCFYTDYEKIGNITINIDGQYIGNLNKYFPNTPPHLLARRNCEF